MFIENRRSRYIDEGWIESCDWEDRVNKLLDVGSILSLMDERSQVVFTSLLNGFTLEEIGKHYGITRERIRQIATITERRIKIELALSEMTWQNGGYSKWRRSCLKKKNALAPTATAPTSGRSITARHAAIVQSAEIVVPPVA